MEVVFDEVDIS